MVLVEGFKLKAKQITKKHLVSTWKKLTDKPFPKIKALMVSDDDFDHVMRQRHCLEDDLREMEEWGVFCQQKEQMPAFSTLNKPLMQIILYWLDRILTTV